MSVERGAANKLGADRVTCMVENAGKTRLGLLKEHNTVGLIHMSSHSGYAVQRLCRSEESA